MDKITISILIISVVSVTLYFVIEDAMSDHEEVVKKTWYFVPVNCWLITEVKYSDKLRGQHEPCGCGVYSQTIDPARAVPIEMKWMLDKDQVNLDYSLCVELKGGYGIRTDKEQ